MPNTITTAISAAIRTIVLIFIFAHEKGASREAGAVGVVFISASASARPEAAASKDMPVRPAGR